MTAEWQGRFNQAYRDICLPIPAPRLDKESKVPGVDGQKMSKSYGNTIEIFAESRRPSEGRNERGDRQQNGRQTESNSETCNVFAALFSLFANDVEKAELAERYRAGGMGYGDAKKQLLAKMDAYFAPARAKRTQLLADPGYVEDVLQQGAKRARAEAQATMELVRTAVGMKKRPVA